MSPPDDNDHACDWQQYARHLEQKLKEQESQATALKDELKRLKSKKFGRSSEKMPSPDQEIRRQKRKEDLERQKAEALRKRQENAIAKTKLKTTETHIPVPPDQCTCPKCGNADLKEVGKGKTSTIIRFIPEQFVRVVFHRQTLKCACGKHIITAPPPEKALERTRYDEGFVAHLMVSKCADSIPIYRLEKQYKRAGLNISRATMNELLHRHAELLEPIYRRMLELVRDADVVLADETPIKQQTKRSKSWVWAFLSDEIIVYCFSSNRSGDTPKKVLGGSEGTLVADAYTGYNAIAGVDGRDRAGCLAHARRGLFNGRESDPSVADALGLIQKVYRAEHDAKEAGIAKTAEHLELRQKRAAPAMAELKRWLDERKDASEPKGTLGKAIRYALNNWSALTLFLQDAKIPVDNNRSERALRVIALGRKNFLFVGHETAGKNLAGVYSLIATCEAAGVNPMEYLPDVMRRISSHPSSDIDALLPHRWQPTA